MEATETVLRWVLSAPVLTLYLRRIASGDAPGDPEWELKCTVVDLLDPDRGERWAQYLRATGAPEQAANAVWAELGGDPARWMDTVSWPQVRDALLRTPVDVGEYG